MIGGELKKGEDVGDASSLPDFELEESDLRRTGALGMLETCVGDAPASGFDVLSRRIPDD